MQKRKNNNNIQHTWYTPTHNNTNGTGSHIFPFGGYTWVEREREHHMDFGWCSFGNICRCNINNIIYQEAPTLPKHSSTFLYFEQQGVKRKGKKVGRGRGWWPPYIRVDMPVGCAKEHVALWTLLWYLTYSSVPKGKGSAITPPQRLPTNPLPLHRGGRGEPQHKLTVPILWKLGANWFVCKPISGSSGI
jgi:hypothetical protein